MRNSLTWRASGAKRAALPGGKPGGFRLAAVDFDNADCNRDKLLYYLYSNFVMAIEPPLRQI
jgi:hypothetical protein